MSRVGKNGGGDTYVEADRVFLVTIGMPVYNGARYLEEAVRSLLAQTERDFLLHISDNCSTDETPEICARLAREDPRVRYVRQASNIGALPNFDLLLREARGAFFMWAAHDDLWDPDFIAEALRRLSEEPDALACVVGVRLIDATGMPTGTAQPPAGLASTDPVVRAKAVTSPGYSAFYGVFRRDLLTFGVPNVAEGDVAFLFRVALRGPFCMTNSILFFNRTPGPAGWHDKYKGSGIAAALFEGRPQDFRWRMMAYSKEAPLSVPQRVTLTAYVYREWLRDVRRSVLYDSPHRVRRAVGERRYLTAGLLSLRHAILRPRRALAELRTRCAAVLRGGRQ